MYACLLIVLVNIDTLLAYTIVDTLCKISRFAHTMMAMGCNGSHYAHKWVGYTILELPLRNLLYRITAYAHSPDIGNSNCRY